MKGKVLSSSLCQYTYRYIKDEATESDKIKVKTLSKELINDSKNKILQIEPIRDHYASEIGFQIGTIMGYIREKYKTMLELYRLDANKYEGKAKIILPRIPLVRPIHYILRMETILSLEVEIDRLVHILQTIPNATIGMPHIYRRAGRHNSHELDPRELSNYKAELYKKLQLFP